MKTRACIIFYNDTPKLLGACLSSLEGKVDEILCIDGAYKDFPHSTPHSTDGCLELAMKKATFVIPCSSPWADQIAKRNRCLEESKNFKGYLFIIDADEQLVGELPAKLTAPEYKISVVCPTYYLTQIRLFKNRRGLQYRNRHCYLYDGSNMINQPDFNSGAPLLDGLSLNHNFHLRPVDRLEQDGKYMRERADQPSPASQLPSQKGLINLMFLGCRYEGFDGNTPVDISYEQVGLFSPEKAQQLLTDFPNDWRKK